MSHSAGSGTLVIISNATYGPTTITLGTLQVGNGGPVGSKPISRTAVLVGKASEANEPPAGADAGDQILRILPGANRYDELPMPSAIFTAICDRMVVLGDVYPRKGGSGSESVPAEPRTPDHSRGTGPSLFTASTYAWAPAALDRGQSGSSLEDWMALPWQSPSELVLPHCHTAAETGLRKGGTGDELSFAACGLMASGARSVLISRWALGGQSTTDLMREYVQELPHLPAAAAWQRSVQLARRNPVDPEAEPRVLKEGWDERITADHPLFWAGYLLLDTGIDPGRP